MHSITEEAFDNHGKPIKNFKKAVAHAMRFLTHNKFIKHHTEIDGIGHRIVHGGHHTESEIVTMNVIATIKKFIPNAPLHNPANLACILACKKLFPRITQVAVFDTAFHHTIPEKAYLYGLPYSFYKRFGMRKYGFHGTSHSYVFEQARKKLGARAVRRTVTCHLGNGCSLTAILNGKAIDTSMGFTPLEGVPMGTRPGDFDPAIIFYLHEKGYSFAKIKDILIHKSGLRGVSELSSDMRDIWAAYKKHDNRAVRTLKWFAYRIAKYIGAYAVALGGLDCIVFTAGIGENAFYLRKMVLDYLKIFPRKHVLVIHTDEELKIAEETLKFIR